MPRFGSFCSDNVLRVPNETGFLIVASMLRASISRTMFEIVRCALAELALGAGWFERQQGSCLPHDEKSSRFEKLGKVDFEASW